MLGNLLLFRSICFYLVIGGLHLLPAISWAQVQSNAEQTHRAISANDPTLPEDRLKVILRPLMKEELEVEAQAWLDLLRDKIRQVGETELKIKEQADAEEKTNTETAAEPKEEGEAEAATDDTLTKELVRLKKEEAALAQHARIVLDALKAKGGDAESAEQFIKAVSDISETTDSTSYRAALVAEVTNWASREDGGKLWARRAAWASLILLVFYLISKIAGRVASRVLSRQAMASNLLENFAQRTAGGIVFVVGLLMALSVLGVEIAPMLAALGAGGFIVGFALQETLGSFASGLMLMVYRPFDVDDYVEVAGVAGTVKEMSLVSTTLVTIDNKVLVIPNKKAWGDTIVNYTGRDLRRVDLVFGIDYSDDIQHAMEVLKEIASEHPDVLDEPGVSINIDELADSSVNLFCRPWVKTENYWDVRWDLTYQVKLRFDAEGISFPFPQRDVHVNSLDVPSGRQQVAGLRSD